MIVLYEHRHALLLQATRENSSFRTFSYSFSSLVHHTPKHNKHVKGDMAQ